jgi:hypothetical protein
MLAGLLSQSYDTRKPSVFVHFPLLQLISFNGEAEAEAKCSSNSCGLALND